MTSREQEKAFEAFERRKKEALERNDGYQRKKMMTQEERSRLAIDKMAGEYKEHFQKQGREVTGDEAMRWSVKNAQDAERKRD